MRKEDKERKRRRKTSREDATKDTPLHTIPPSLARTLVFSFFSSVGQFWIPYPLFILTPSNPTNRVLACNNTPYIHSFITDHQSLHAFTLLPPTHFNHLQSQLDNWCVGFFELFFLSFFRRRGLIRREEKGKILCRLIGSWIVFTRFHSLSSLAVFPYVVFSNMLETFRPLILLSTMYYIVLILHISFHVLLARSR